jgi:DNA-binding response OmpR family regulator
MLILVIEDEGDYADVVTETLRRQSHEVVSASSAGAALRFVDRRMPDMVIVDVALPDASGLDLARQFREMRDDLPVIFVSNLSRASDIVAGFNAGADEYISKPFHPSEFLARVAAVARRAQGLPIQEEGDTPRIDGNGLEFDHVNGAAYFGGANLHCTRLEYELLQELATVPGQVLSHAYLNERLWGYSNLSDSSLLKGHVHSLRKKLTDAGLDGDVIRTVHRVGYAFTELPDSQANNGAP